MKKQELMQLISSPETTDIAVRHHSMKTDSYPFSHHFQNGIYDLAEAMPQLVWTTDASGNINYINKKCLEYTGDDQSTVDISHWFDALHPDDCASSFEQWDQCLQTGNIFQKEYRLKRHDGVYHWFLGRAVPVKDDYGCIQSWIGTATDIEEHKGLMRDLQHSRDQLQIILEGITDGVTVFDALGNFIYANKMGAKMCGFDSVDEMLSTPSAIIMDRYELLDETGLPFPIENLPGRLALQGVRNPPETILQFRMKSSGKKRWSIVNAAPVFDSYGRVLYAVSIFRDFTIHKENENALKNREASFRIIAEAGVILNSSLDYLSNLKQLCQLVVPQMADWCVIDLIGITVDKPQTIVWHADPHKRTWAIEYLKKYRNDWTASQGVLKVMNSGVPVLYEKITDDMLARSARDELHLCEIRRLGMNSVMIVPVIGSSRILGTITFIAAGSEKSFSDLDLTVATDIGRRAGISIGKSLLYDSEKTAREIAENANKSKSTFLANMSHEIRTPLNALIGFNELLRSHALDDEVRAEYHNIIQRNGELLLHLIDDILDLSKVEAGHLALDISSVALPELLAEVSSFMRAKAASKQLDFKMQIIGDLPDEFTTDPLRLKQILNNIIGNAIKFTEVGFVKISVKMDHIRGTLVFTVVDSGIGIQSQLCEKLFQPFTQADASVTRKFGGTGLGLILSKKLAQGLGGDIFLKESIEGQGTTFIIEIAGAKSKNHSPALDSECNSQNTHHSLNENESLAGRRILVVDDSIDNQILIEYILKMRGAEIDLAENGSIGVTKALDGDHDIILMDIQMPVLDGHSATRLLRENHYTRPIIALTAHAMQDDRERCLEVGCTDYLTKPINTNLLVSTINRYIHH